jgi:hypothetical protein
LSEIDDLLDWLKYRQTIWRKATSKLAVLTPLLVALTDFPPLRDQPLAKKTVEKIEDVRSELKPKTQIEANVRRSSETVSQFEDIKQAVYETFQRKNEEPNPNGLIDKAWLYIQIRYRGSGLFRTRTEPSSVIERKPAVHSPRAGCEPRLEQGH